MYFRLLFVGLSAVLLQQEYASSQQIPSLTAAELWNPTTWFYPFAIATAESYRDYYQKAQKANNELYQQIYATNAFPWRNWGSPQKPAGQNGQENQNSQNGGNKENQSQTNKAETTTPSNQQTTKSEPTTEKNNMNSNVEDQTKNPEEQ